MKIPLKSVRMERESVRKDEVKRVKDRQVERSVTNNRGGRQKQDLCGKSAMVLQYGVAE